MGIYMGMNGDLIYNILRLSRYNDTRAWVYPQIPINPERDLWVKINPHKSPFPI